MDAKDRFARIEKAREERGSRPAGSAGKRCDACLWRLGRYWARTALLCPVCAERMAGSVVNGLAAGLLVKYEG